MKYLLLYLRDMEIKTEELGIFLQLFKSSPCPITNPAPFTMSYNTVHEGEQHPSEREGEL